MFSKSKEHGREKRNSKPEEKLTQHRETKLFAGLAAGVIGGLVATWALEKYQQGAVEATRRAESAVNAEPTLSRQQEEQLREQQRAHGEAAHRIAKSAVGRKLKPYPAAQRGRHRALRGRCTRRRHYGLHRGDSP